ncbi:MAG: glucosylceramidase [Cyclobacteriaceae bacterium]|jgi:glucosylceramidase
MKEPLIIFVLAITLFSCTDAEKKTEPPQMETLKNRNSLVVYQTARDTETRLTKIGEFSFEARGQALEWERSIFVNSGKSFQTFLGIGGAITDASAEVFAKLSAENQEELLNAYYSKSGLDYSLIRTTIHSADFGPGSYTYIDEGDKELKTFSIAHDLAYRIPMIKLANKTAGKNLLLYASPWSPPAFMKTNNNMLQGGKLLPEFADAWATYYTKFIEAYEAEDLPIWGITIQNEPMAVQRWESCIYTAEEERDFLKNHLGPTMEAAGYGDKKIVVWDHNRDLISDRANVIFEDPEASKYAWGIGFHWYETWAGGEENFDNLKNIKESYPDKNLLFTEGCNEAFDTEKYQFWPNAERYGKNIINDFNSGTVGWTDWNILLDEKGGPNHVGNFCFAPIHADLSKGELVYTPTYFYLGHFSKFIQPGAKRISTTTSHTNLLSTTWLNEDGKMATIVMNGTDNPIAYSLYINDQETKVKISAHAIQTLIY